MIIIDLFDIDFHIFTVIKFLFNLVVRFNQNQSLSVPLAQQSVNGTQQALLRSPTQQSFIEEQLSVDLNAPIGTTDDRSKVILYHSEVLVDYIFDIIIQHPT